MTRQDMSIYTSGGVRELSYYGGRLQENYEVQEPNIELAYIVLSGFPVLSRMRVGLKEIRLTIDFFGQSDAEAWENYSNFIGELAGGRHRIILPDRTQSGGTVYYTVILDKVVSATLFNVGSVQAEFSLLGTRHGELTVVSTSSNQVNCISTIPETPCRITVTVGADATNYQVGTVVFDSVTAGEVLTVDGLKMRILVNGAPAAARATFTEFPVLKPGSNSITCDDRVTVQYYPLYF